MTFDASLATPGTGSKSRRQPTLACATVALAVASALGLLMCADSAAAAPAGQVVAIPSQAPLRLPSTRRFVYRAEGKRLTDVLQDFAASQGLPGVAAEGLEGVVNANFDSPPEVFLDTMAKAYGILWYYDGTALYFYPGRAIQSRMFRLKGFRRQQVASILHSLGVNDRRYPLRYDETQNTLYVSGPPRHVELVATAIEALDAGVAGNVVRVFGLKFASASDRVLGDVTLPGVATSLRHLFEPGSAAGNGADASSGFAPSNATRKKLEAMLPKVGPGQYMPPLPRSSAATGNEGTAISPRASDTPHGTEEDAPRFEADEGSNAVMVYGRTEKMADYEALIRQLDQKPVLVELEATIIEVDSDSASALGVNWSVSSGGGSSFQVDSPTSPNFAPTQVYSLGTVIANAGRELLLRVNALQRNGKARIVSKPMVLGVANRSAVMREKRVATVRVAGNLEANLFQVEAGTLLQMTPQVVGGDGPKRIKLSIYIEDGNFEAGTVDQVPIVKKSEIRTEAHVLEGESLLVGGITVESDLTDVSGVPGLSKLPVIGALFRNRERHITRNERLFLITPRVLDGRDLQRVGRSPSAVELPASAPVLTPVPAPGPAASAMGNGEPAAAVPTRPEAY